MKKVVRKGLLVVLLVASFALAAFDAKQALSQADGWLKTKETQSVLKAYHAYKNIRINAIMQGDTTLQSKALQGVITSGKLLHIDVAKYKIEYDRLGIKTPVVVSVDDTEDQEEANDEISSDVQRKLVDVKWRYGHVVLTFDDALKEEDIHYFVLDEKFNQKYRYIFDIKSLPTKNFTLNSKELTDVRMSLYSPEILRLVIENQNPIKLRYARKGRELIIDVRDVQKSAEQSPKVVDQKTVYTTKRPSNTKSVVVLDAGHGGKDTGALGYKNYREKIITMQVTQRVKKELEKMGFEVHLTRNSDKYVKLQNRTAFANDKNADVFVSIHANAVAKKGNYQRHHGIETYFLSPARNARAKKVAAKENIQDMTNMDFYAKESFLNIINRQKILASNKLAIDIQKGMLSNLRKYYDYISDKGVREGPFWVLVGAQMPAVLIEMGFISNPKEAKRLVNSHYQTKLAQGIANGIKHYFQMNR